MPVLIYYYFIGESARQGYKLVSRVPAEPLRLTDDPNQPELENGIRYLHPDKPAKFEFIFARADAVDNTALTDSLVVKVVDHQGRPLPFCKVNVDGKGHAPQGQGGIRWLSGKSNSQGIATFANFSDFVTASGRYTVQVFGDSTDEGYTLAPCRMSVTDGRLHREDPLVAYAKDETKNNQTLTFTLHPPCPLNFRVQEKETEKPIGFASVVFRDDRVKQWTWLSFFDAEGQYNMTTIIEAMNDAEYLAAKQGYYPQPFKLDRPLKPEFPQQQVKPPGKLKNLKTISLAPAPLIQLTVLQPNGQIAQDAKIEYIAPTARRIGSYKSEPATNDLGESRFGYPALGDMVRYRITHASGSAEIAVKDLPKPIWQQSKTPKEATLTNSKGWALIRHRVQLEPVDRGGRIDQKPDAEEQAMAQPDKQEFDEKSSFQEELVASVAGLATDDAPAALESERWHAVPTQESLMAKLKERDAAFGDYRIEFDQTRVRKRHPIGEWWSQNWKSSRQAKLDGRAPLKPPADLDPPHVETMIQRYVFATYQNEEHMDWWIKEIRKDDKLDKEDPRVGNGMRYSSWKDAMRSGRYKTDGSESYEYPLPFAPSGLSPTLLNTERLDFELCAGIGMSQRIKQIDKMELVDGMLRVSGEILVIGDESDKFQVDFTKSLIPRRLEILLLPKEQIVMGDGSRTKFSKMQLQTTGTLENKLAPPTPESVKFVYSATFQRADGSTWDRDVTKLDLNFTAARGQVELVEFKKLAEIGKAVGTASPKAKFIVDGPFEDGKKVAANAQSTEIAQLRCVRVKRKSTEGQTAARLEVKFQFLGEKDPNRKLNLRVALLDSNGKVLGRADTLCSDSRLAVSDNPTISVSRENSESLKVKLSPVDLDRIHQVEVEFQEADTENSIGEVKVDPKSFKKGVPANVVPGTPDDKTKFIKEFAKKLEKQLPQGWSAIVSGRSLIVQRDNKTVILSNFGRRLRSDGETDAEYYADMGAEVTLDVKLRFAPRLSEKKWMELSAHNADLMETSKNGIRSKTALSELARLGQKYQLPSYETSDQSIFQTSDTRYYSQIVDQQANQEYSDVLALLKKSLPASRGMGAVAGKPEFRWPQVWIDTEPTASFNINQTKAQSLTAKQTLERFNSDANSGFLNPQWAKTIDWKDVPDFDAWIKSKPELAEHAQKDRDPTPSARIVRFSKRLVEVKVIRTVGRYQGRSYYGVAKHFRIPRSAEVDELLRLAEMEALSFSRTGRAIPAEQSPKRLFDMLFVKADAEAARRLAMNQSALDEMMADAQDLRGILSCSPVVGTWDSSTASTLNMPVPILSAVLGKAVPNRTKRTSTMKINL